MDATSRELLARIEAFQFDRPDAPFVFSARLARDNGWTPQFAHRAIREYRRFAFLAIAAGHPVAPSDEVDQVWHEHLTYTRSYWDEFCGEVLRRPLHHEPTRGGADEGRKFDDWYARTLESYRRFFGEEAPADLWPPASIRFDKSARHSRIDTAKNWIIPKPLWMRPALRIAAVFACAALVAGCGAVIASGLGPLDYRGPEFLGFFWTLAACAIIAGAFLRRMHRAGPYVTDTTELTPYAAAVLNGGHSIAVNAALASLVHRGSVAVDASNGTLTANGAPDASAPALERAVFARISALASAKQKDLATFAMPVLLDIENDLKTRGLLMSDEAVRRARWQPLLLCFAVLALGDVKILIGLGRDKPVALLVISCIAFVIIALVSFARRPHRTRAGDAHLESLRRQHAALKTESPTAVPAMAATALPLAIGLFGYSVLDHTEMAGLRRHMQPQGAGDSSSGCSSSGGGSDGGGDGGGGGGCGGCGGGGGD